MTKHAVASRQEWLQARIALLAAEKEHTRRGDELARQRRELPWVKLDRQYRFDTEAGSMTLAELFRGRSQLLVYHFMFGPDYTAGCPSCSSIADGFNGIVDHLANHDVMLWAVSRAPLPRLLAYRQRMGWTFPWASSNDTSFSFDFAASFSPEQQRSQSVYNFEQRGPMPWRDGETGSEAGPVGVLAAMAGTDAVTYTGEREGLSTFVRDGDTVYHAYSAYARGVDAVWGVYAWLDRAPFGRNESGVWWRRRDEYARAEQPR